MKQSLCILGVVILLTGFVPTVHARGATIDEAMYWGNVQGLISILSGSSSRTVELLENADLFDVDWRMDVIVEARLWGTVNDAYLLLIVPRAFDGFDEHFRKSLAYSNEAGILLESGIANLDDADLRASNDFVVDATREMQLATAAIPPIDFVSSTDSIESPTPVPSATPSPSPTTAQSPTPVSAVAPVDVSELPLPEGDPVYAFGGQTGATAMGEPLIDIKAGTYRGVFTCDDEHSLAWIQSDSPKFSTIVRRGNGAVRIPESSSRVSLFVTCNSDWSLALYHAAPNASSSRLEISVIVVGTENFTPSPNGEGCATSGTFVDIGLGSSVIIYDASHEALGYSVFDQMERVGMTGCRFRVILFDLPDEPSFLLSIGDREFSFTRKELEQSGWSIVLTIP